MTLLAILVDIELVAGAEPAFMPIIRANAAASMRDEPGCHRFDILLDPADPERIVLYEVYADAAAFDAHLRAPHFVAFQAAADHLIRAQRLRRLRPA